MPEFTALSDDALEAAIKRLAAEERGRQAVQLVQLAEFDTRGLAHLAGFPTLYAYCVRELGWSEGAAYERVRAAQAALRFPIILERLKEGRLTMAGVAILAPLLNDQNCSDLLDEAAGLGRKDLEALLAALMPRPDRDDAILPAVEALRADSPAAAQKQLRDKIEALSAERVHFGFTGSVELRRALERSRALLWHRDPSGKLEGVIGSLADFFLDRKDPDRKLGLAARKPAEKPRDPARGPTRMIPQAVKDEVWLRDEGRCSFVAPGGRRCEADTGLEYDHIVPWVLGGRSDAAVNVRLLCREHNQWAAREMGLAPLGVGREGGTV